MSDQPKAKPTVKLRDGVLSVAIWANKSEEGNIFYSTTYARGYKDGDEWKETTSLGADDLLKVSRLLQRAYDKIVELKQM